MSNYLAEMQSLQVKFVGELAVSNTVSKDATPAVGHAKEALCYQLFVTMEEEASKLKINCDALVRAAGAATW